MTGVVNWNLTSLGLSLYCLREGSVKYDPLSYPNLDAREQFFPSVTYQWLLPEAGNPKHFQNAIPTGWSFLEVGENPQAKRGRGPKWEISALDTEM